jgi:hypothetical protein
MMQYLDEESESSSLPCYLFWSYSRATKIAEPLCCTISTGPEHVVPLRLSHGILVVDFSETVSGETETNDKPQRRAPMTMATT